MNPSRLVRILFALALVQIAVPFSLHGQEQTESELQEIRDQIKQKQQQVARQLEQAKVLEDALKKAELEIAGTARALNQTQIKLENNMLQERELNTREKDLQRETALQERVLAKQLRSAYMTGNYDYAKVVFNQQDAGKFERVLTYYQYLTKARVEQLNAFRLLVEELTEVRNQLVDTRQQLQSLEAEQQTQRNRLLGQQNHRKQTLAKIETVIDTEAAQIEQLQINERALLKAISEAEAQARRSPADLRGLENVKGKLVMPADGRLRRLFGLRRQGQVRWKGILIDSNSGNPVRAVHDGKVLYADWLRGFGLVTVLDHGQGYMSLYGHNQALLKQVGDQVEAGETIGLVGQSGGQTNPNLYFEIRHKGQPLNPSQWLPR